MGHENGIVTLFVDKNILDEETVQVEKLLKSNGITQYDVFDISNCVQLINMCQVGSRIQFTHGEEEYGTLGCFVKRKMSGEDQICALTAEHVAQHFRDGEDDSEFCNFLLNEEDVQIKKTSLITCSEPQLDIAAFVLSESIKSKLEVNARFKTRENEEKECNTYEWENQTELDDRVYLRGATTAFGEGNVTSCNTEGDNGELLIKIEDIEGKPPFCREGDSGSIVCFDDDNCIQAVGLLFKGNVDDPPYYYFAIKLNHGLSELSKKNGNISLFNGM